jgi:hypothetical protein
MKDYKPVITLVRNERGCYILDTVKGCSVCGKEKPLGCYDNCYAMNIASRYGFDFSKPVKRDFQYDTEQVYFCGFDDEKHTGDIIGKIKKMKMPFVRIGEMGDPSEDWNHTINVCRIIATAEKPIVIITKHWKTIPDELLPELSSLKICINTSISALDNNYEIAHRLEQYNRLKPFCKSVLRIVSCDFNKDNPEGLFRSVIQDELFKNENIIDTVFRPNAKNPLVTNGIINVDKVKFLKSKVLASVYNKNAYFGRCENCPDMCGKT